ncbi:MAG TPA: hypothetical protein VH281_05265 [Gaiellaceae bacterium]
MLRFVGEEERSPEGLINGNGNGSPSATARDPVGPKRRLGSLVEPFRRGKAERTESELVSRRWSGSEELQLELDRSRRFGHRFALIYISSRRGIESGWSSLHDLGHAVSSLLRRIDRVWVDGTGVYLLLPECDRTMVEAALDRLREPLSRLVGDSEPPAVSSAVFPDDGLTSAALLGALKDNRHASSAVARDQRSTPAA